MISLNISIHSLRMEGDFCHGTYTSFPANFNPLPPHGGRLDLSCHPPSFKLFQSTPSAWRETAAYGGSFSCAIFQSTPSAWRETSLSCSESQVPDHFNPLPPHGGRLRLIKFNICMHIISIHSLRMEGDIEEKKQFALGKAFQSTPSAWRETHIYLLLTFTTFYFNPLPPHGGRLIIRFFAYIVNSISIHSLRMEGDCNNDSRLFIRLIFQSTPSAWRET